MKTTNSKTAKEATQAQRQPPTAAPEGLHVQLPQGEDCFSGTLNTICCRRRTKDKLGLIHATSEQNVWLLAELSLPSLRALAFRLREVKTEFEQEISGRAENSMWYSFSAVRGQEDHSTLKISVEADHHSGRAVFHLRCSGWAARLSLGTRDRDCLLYAVERVITKFETNDFIA